MQFRRLGQNYGMRGRFSVAAAKTGAGLGCKIGPVSPKSNLQDERMLDARCERMLDARCERLLGGDLRPVFDLEITT